MSTGTTMIFNEVMQNNLNKTELSIALLKF